MKRYESRGAAVVIALIALSLIGCGKQGDKPAAGASDSATVTAGGGDTSISKGTEPTPDAVPPKSDGGVRSYIFHGTVTKIDKAAASVEVDHERIPGYAEAGTKLFKVANPQLLETLAVGHETHFTIRVAGDVTLLTGVEQGHAPGKEH